MRVLSGIQPSGQPHLGNYFGYMKPNINLLDEGTIHLMVADLHALTTVHDAKVLKQCRHDVALDLLSCGFDPKKGVLFFQSDIPEHAELAWLLACVTPMGLLERAVSYKDKVEQGLEGNVGLFTYPVLQTADILLYQADTVPVGKDQKQHIEIARDIAVKFNTRYGKDLFVLPEARISETVAVVPGTDGKKMSKSYGNTIPLFGTDAQIKKAVMGIVTDSKGQTDAKDPDTCVIYQIHKLFLSDAEKKALADEYRNGLAYGDAKKKLLEAYMDYFGAMRAKREEFLKKPGFVDEVMQEGAKKAGAIAQETMERVRTAVGLR